MNEHVLTNHFAHFLFFGEMRIKQSLKVSLMVLAQPENISPQSK
jgi:hypothetical protein